MIKPTFETNFPKPFRLLLINVKGKTSRKSQETRRANRVIRDGSEKKPDHIDKTIDVFLDFCPHCGNKDISPCNHTTEHIQEDLEDGKVIVTRDETGWKDDWLWIFTNPDIAFYHIDESRGSKVVIDHLGSFFKGILITDFWNAYIGKIPAFAKQKCLRHILGDIKELLDKELPKRKGKRPNAEVFLEDVKELFKDAIFLKNQHSALTPDEYRSGRKNIIKRFRKLYQHEPLSHHKSNNIRKRLIKFKNELFVFLKYPAVEPANNFAEQGIRPCVLFRKISFGNMTLQGQKSVV